MRKTNPAVYECPKSSGGLHTWVRMRGVYETAECLNCNRDGDDYVLDIKANGVLQMHYRFDTASERQRVHDDLLNMMRQLGAKDLPPHTM